MLAMLAALLFGCSSNNYVNMDGKTKVVFELEGGFFQNCEGIVTYYYDIPEDGEMLIYSPQTLSSRDVTRNKYVFKGWFKTKTVNGNNAIYSDEWNFETDTIDKNGVTLYAKWELLSIFKLVIRSKIASICGANKLSYFSIVILFSLKYAIEVKLIFVMLVQI